jgi:hypothetical protein
VDKHIYFLCPEEMKQVELNTLAINDTVDRINIVKGL